MRFKRLFRTVILLLIPFALNSCGYLLGGPITSCQTAKPLGGKRELRIGFLIADIVFLPVLPVDFITGGVYKPCHKISSKRKAPKS
jgi:hypothetical protein